MTAPTQPQSTRPHIVVDRNELNGGSRIVTRWRFSCPGYGGPFEESEENLFVGDYALVGPSGALMMLIERKTGPDLVRSVTVDLDSMSSKARHIRITPGSMIIAETSMEEIMTSYPSQANAVLGGIEALRLIGVPTVLAGNRQNAIHYARIAFLQAWRFAFKIGNTIGKAE